jgi:hypothetical protein
VALATAGEGYSGQTVLHFKNAISAVFRLAKKLRLYPEENPAAGVELPEVKAQRRPVLNWEEARRALAHLPSPVREMAILGMTTSLGAAELTGIRLKHANLTNGIVCVEGEALAPYSIAVRENYYHGQYGSLKTGSRCRNLAITPELAEMLRTLVLRSKRQDSEAPLFQSRTGTPVCVHNISTRIFRPLGRKLGFPITWHSFRRACATFADQLGASLGERMAVMGHTTSRMTLHYSMPMSSAGERSRPRSWNDCSNRRVSCNDTIVLHPASERYQQEGVPMCPECVQNLSICLPKGRGSQRIEAGKSLKTGRRGWTRTSDHLLRRQVLYPPELRARTALSPTSSVTIVLE